MSQSDTPEAAATGNAIVVSKRGLNRLADLQHKLSQEMQVLASQHSRLMGALMACDANTQRTMMLEYRDQLHSVHQVLSKLCVVIDRHGQELGASME